MQCVLYEQGALVRVCDTAWGLQDRKLNPMALERDRMRMVDGVANLGGRNNAAQPYCCKIFAESGLKILTPEVEASVEGV